MKKYIEELKTRSHAEKSSYAFMASLTLTGMIVALWILAILINPSDYIEIESDPEQNMANAGSLFDVFGQNLKSLK